MTDPHCAAALGADVTDLGVLQHVRLVERRHLVT